MKRGRDSQFAGFKFSKRDDDLREFKQQIDREEIEHLKKYDFSDVCRASLRMAQANPNLLIQYLENHGGVEAQIELDELLKSG